jgi:CO dehydrogenase/acetyl-CoA synthase delta subunit
MENKKGELKMDFKDLSQVIKMCRKNGVKELKIEGLELILEDSVLKLPSSKPTTLENKETISRQEQNIEQPKEKQIDNPDLDDLVVSDPIRWEMLAMEDSSNGKH